MNIKEIKSAILELSAKEVRELLVWLTEHHARLWSQELDRRLDAYHANPEAGASWPEVRQRILGQKI